MKESENVNGLSRSLILEIIRTFTLVYVILTTLHNTKNKIAASVGLQAIGFTVGFNVIWGGSVSGASMNPALSFWSSAQR